MVISQNNNAEKKSIFKTKIAVISTLIIAIAAATGVGIGIGYAIFKTGSESGTDLELPKKYGTICDSSEQTCLTVSEHGFVCAAGVCICAKSGYYLMDTDICAAKRQYGESCNGISVCDESINLSCLSKNGGWFCDCPWDRSWNGTMCAELFSECPLSLGILCNGGWICPNGSNWTGTVCESIRPTTIAATTKLRTTCYSNEYWNGNKCAYSQLVEAFDKIKRNQSNLIIITPPSSLDLRTFTIYNNKYYIIDSNEKIYEYNAYWTYSKTIDMGTCYYMILVNNSFYVSNTWGLEMFDSSFSMIINGFYDVDQYRGVYYDKDRSLIIVASYSGSQLHTFDLSLNFISAIDITPESSNPHGVYGYDGKYYTSSGDGQIVTIENDTVLNTFSNNCHGYYQVPQIYIDSQGVIAVPCLTTNLVYLFSPNGTNLELTVSVNSPMDVGFDMNYRLIIVTSSNINRYI